MENLPVIPAAVSAFGDRPNPCSRSTSPSRPPPSSITTTTTTAASSRTVGVQPPPPLVIHTGSSSPHSQQQLPSSSFSVSTPLFQSQSNRHNVITGKRSEPLISRARRRSPAPVRKGLVEGALQLPPAVNVTHGLSSGTSGSASTLHSRPSLHSSIQDDSQLLQFSTDDGDLPSLDSTANLSNGSSTEYLGGNGPEDYVDCGIGTPDLQRTRAAIELIHQKVQRTKDQIGTEQKTRDENVNEYLKLAGNADKQQLQRIKNVFEKKNQKSAQTISQLQKKLDNYTKRIRELEMHGLSSHHRPAKEVIRDVGQGINGVVGNIKGGITGLTQATQNAAETVMSKPREFAHLIKNKFGSADNINTMTNTKWFVAEAGEDGVLIDHGTDLNHHHHNSATFSHHTKYTSDDECSSVTSGSGPTAGTGTMSSPRNQPPIQTCPIAPACSTAVFSSTVVGSLPSAGEFLPVASAVHQPHGPFGLDSVLQELQDRRDECQRLQEYVDSLKNQMNQEMMHLNHTLAEERYHCERLEEQMNDLIELHQNEIENLKQGISDMEEKLQYQSEERLRDMHEMMESCQTRISRIEHQQHEQQQLVTLEGIENSNARALVLKLINVLLTVLQVVLLLVATAANILMPFLKTRVRILTTFLLVCAILCGIQQWHGLVNYIGGVIYRYRNSVTSE